jgi:16S rRNA (guanine527-N7)-methyltransferase
VKERVASVMAALGAPPEAADRVAAWVLAISEANRRIDLTAARDEAELVDLMVADACVLARVIGPGARVVDVGSGAGAPGLGLALLRPDLRLTLVEPLEKRVTFLRTTIGTLYAGRAREEVPAVVRARGEAVVGRAFDVAISRATLAPEDWLALGLQLAPEVYVLLAQADPPVHPDGTVTLDERYVWPGTGASRRLLRVHRAG